MPEFDQIHLNAKEFYNRIAGNPSGVYRLKYLRHPQHNFFHSGLTSQDPKTKKDAKIVSLVATSLNKTNDCLFNQFLARFPTPKDHRIRCYEEFQEIKKQILIGCYLMHLHKATLDNNKPLIELLCEDLEINQLSNYKQEYIDSCFTWLSRFCGFVSQYNKEDDGLLKCADYDNLILHLPLDIQTVISNAKFRRTEQDSSGLENVLSMGLTMLSSFLPTEEPHDLYVSTI